MCGSMTEKKDGRSNSMASNIILTPKFISYYSNCWHYDENKKLFTAQRMANGKFRTKRQQDQ